jgi:S1-C subfamily serine protease
MNKLRVLISVAALLVAGQVGAQDDAREADVQRRLAEAEARMAEAARQIAELTTERLPQINRIERRIKIMDDGRPRLGVTIGTDEDGAVEGTQVLAVTPGSAASDSGLRAGDIITAVNGESLSADSAEAAGSKLVDFMKGVEPGDTLAVEYLRDGKVGKVEVEPKPVSAEIFAFGGGPIGMPDIPGLEAIPKFAGDMKNHFVLNWTSAGWGDMELVELSEGLGRYFGTDEGLLVVRAPASNVLQLEDGDVIQKIDSRKPTSVRHAMRILGSYQPGEKLTLEVMRDRKRRTLEIEIPEDLSSRLAPVPPPLVRPAAAPDIRRASVHMEKT